MDNVRKEIEEISPLLATISKRNVYNTPDGYFEKEPEIPSFRKPKMVNLFRQDKRAIRYAAAAVIAGLLITVGVNQFIVHKDTVEQKIAKLENEEIIEYLNTQPHLTEFSPVSNESAEMYFQNAVENVNTEEIDDYLIGN